MNLSRIRQVSRHFPTIRQTISVDILVPRPQGVQRGPLPPLAQHLWRCHKLCWVITSEKLQVLAAF